MGQTVTLDVSWWQAILGLFMAVGGVAGMVGIMLRLWMQPQVGEWIDRAMKRERTRSDEQIALMRLDVGRFQQGNNEWRSGIERQMDNSERRIEKAVDALSGKMDDVVGELAGVREQLGLLTGRVTATEKAAL